MFELSERVLDPAALRRTMANFAAGGFVSFEGWVRDTNEGAAVRLLEYEAYAELACLEGQTILDEAHRRFKLIGARAVHRVGVLGLGELAVWIGVSAAHRDEAYRANRYLIDEIKKRVPIWKKETYDDGRSEWVNCTNCHRHAHALPAHDPTAEREFYARQGRLIGDVAQARLKASSALVVGAGGLGGPVLTQLAASGVGHLTVIDDDRVEISNLARQTHFAFNDHGLDKAPLLKARIAAQNPFVHVSSIQERLTWTNAEALVRAHDVVIEASDNLATKFLLHDVCHRANVPLVMASIYQREGELQVFTPDPGCLRCLWPELPGEHGLKNCAEAGVLGTVPAVLGALQAQFALDVILGRALDRRKILVQLDPLEITKLEMPINKDCWLCAGGDALDPARYVRPRWSVRPAPLAVLAERFTLIDLRAPGERDPAEPVERALADLSRSPGELDLADAHREYLLICQRGQRSAVRARELDRPNVYSLERGVEGLPPC